MWYCFLFPPLILDSLFELHVVVRALHVIETNGTTEGGPICLARLWQQQGKKKEARDLLSEIYNWFTEGFDTKDLQEAKALFSALS
jgi:hypothetical protein